MSLFFSNSFLSFLYIIIFYNFTFCTTVRFQYACRKTLADSRPRVRGRFARNGETETETEPEVEIEATENSYDRHVGYNNYEQAPSTGSGNGDWWWQMPAADEEEECSYDGDIWANFSEDFTMNLPS